MATPKSPFYIVRNFLSAKQCEQIVQNLGFMNPDEDVDGNPLKMIRHNEFSESVIYDRFQPIIPDLEKYYDMIHRGTEVVTFEMYPETTINEPTCEACKYLHRKWVKTKDRDFSCVLFLSDYNEDASFDDDFEVYGGKLEFLQHQFGFNPERGTLIVYPSGPHFINVVAPVQVGDLYMAKFHVATHMPYLYQPANFPGDYRTWFKGLY